MIAIEKIKMRNFKKFSDDTSIKFNEDYNILIGDNESGKSSILLAIDLILSGSQSKIESIGLENLFNVNIVEKFMLGDRNFESLPILFLELYLSDTGISDLNGQNNSDNRVTDGIKLYIEPNTEEFSEIIIDSLKGENAIFPFEYYKCTFKTFSDIPYSNFKKYIKHLIIDSSSISSERAMKDYVTTLYNSYTDNLTKNVHKNKFRQKKNDFTNDELREFNKNVSGFSFGLNSNSKYNLENNLTIYDNKGIDLWNKGSGEQCMLKINAALQRQSQNIDLILIEEPENHLSHSNMNKMLNSIISSKNKQIFVTTHSSMICSRLNLQKVIGLSDEKILTKEFNYISDDTAKFFIKNPSNNILSLILAKRVILVEGAAEYILLEKFYELVNEHNPSDDKVVIICINGLSFLRYLEVADRLAIKVAIITDNDKDYNTNIVEKYCDYKDKDNIKVFSDGNNDNYTFEVSLFKYNEDYIKNNNITTAKDKQDFMLNNKSENAYRILEKLEDNINIDEFNVPNYIAEAIKWIKD